MSNNALKSMANDEDTDAHDEYNERHDAFDKVFGPLNNKVGMLMNLRMNCPGMCIVNSKPKDLPYPEMYITFGLAGARAGTGITTQVVSTETNHETGETTQISKIVQGTRVSGSGFSGYGFEFVAATKVGGEWIQLVLNWMCKLHVTGEFDFFNTMLIDGASTSGPYSGKFSMLGKDTTFLIAPAWGSMPKEVNVSHGKILFYSLINITEEEWKFVQKRGQVALFEKIKSAGIEPLIDPERKSCI